LISFLKHPGISRTEVSVADTLLARLSSAIKPSTIKDLASQHGESDRAISRGIELSTAAVLGGLTRKAGDFDVMREVVDLAGRVGPSAAVSSISGGQPASADLSLITASTRLLSTVFGDSQDAVVDSIAHESGVRTGSGRAILAAGAQSVLSFFGARLREEGLTPSTLSRLLQSERPNLQRALPAGFDEAFSIRSASARSSSAAMAQAVESDPVVAQSVIKERSVLPWLLPLAAVAIGALWFALRPAREPLAEMPIPPAPVIGTSGMRVPTPTASLGAFVPRTLPDGTTLSIPERGVEERLLLFIENPASSPDSITWFDFDRLLFDTGSATLRPESQEQLQNVAAILKANPNVHLKIGGYTDNVGIADQNLTLSDERATNVMHELVRIGVAPNVLEAKGYGQEHPVADNSTEEGRALNRRISMLVTQK
jgi:outer membrane protein OmpA-like peptidoglycan-associated protein